MKKLIVLNAASFVLFTTSAILNAVQDKWTLTAIWLLGALCLGVTGILNYKTFKSRCEDTDVAHQDSACES